MKIFERQDKDLIPILNRLYNISYKIEDKLKTNWKLYEDLYHGSQWDKGTTERRVYEYNSRGERILIRQIDDELNGVKFPRRTQNEIFVQMQSQLSLYIKQNYTVKAESLGLGNDASQKAYKQFLYLKEVFKDFQTEYLKEFFDVMEKGWGYLKLVKESVQKGFVPFRIKRTNPEFVMVDPNADRFENINWAIHTIKKYAFEFKSQYPDIELTDERSDDIIKIKEFWVKNEHRNWQRFVLYDNKLINKENKDIEYPAPPFQMFKAYFKENGIYGISEISLIYEYQKQINKHLSQKDHYLNMAAFPPVAVSGGKLSPETASNLPLKPAGYYEVTGAGTIRPINIDNANAGMFDSSISLSQGEMSRTTGVTKVVEGTNEQGVYSAKHFSAIYESAINRIKLKEVFYKKSLVSIAKASLLWGQKYLGSNGIFKIYSEANGDYVEITASDLDFRDTAISFSTSDANLLTSEGRLDYLIKLKQYAPNFPEEELILTIESVFPDFFRKEFINATEMMAELKYWNIAKQFKAMKDEQDQMTNNENNNQTSSTPVPQPPPPPNASGGGGGNGVSVGGQ